VSDAAKARHRLKLPVLAAFTAANACDYPCGQSHSDPPDVCLPDGGWPCMNYKACGPELAADGGIAYQPDGTIRCFC
jgi:hypothetical protein